jgi:hypothetical protein
MIEYTIQKRIDTMTMKFEDLTAIEQKRARAMFLNAGPQDGYWYTLDIDGKVLCRRKCEGDNV